MREIDINGKKFTARSLRLSEISAEPLCKLGYGRFLFVPNLMPDPPKDLPPDVPPPAPPNEQDRMGEIMDAALVKVFGEKGIDEIDQAGGAAALRAAWKAILAETYGDGDEEKNSRPAGSGKSTPSGLPTAPAAGS